MIIKTDYIKSIPYFNGLTENELESIGRFIKEKTIERGEIVYMDGDQANEICFLVSGAVKVFKTSISGKEQILSILRPGESFNDVPVVDGGPAFVNAQAMSQVVLYTVDRDDFNYLINKYPPIAQNMIKVLARRVRKLVNLVEDLSFRTVAGRVAKILMDTASGTKEEGHKLTQQEMAAMAGTAREVVGRSLKSLEEDGIIKLDRHRIIIKDREVLSKMVRSSI